MRVALCLTLAAITLGSATAGCRRPCAEYSAFASPTSDRAGNGAPSGSSGGYSGTAATPTAVDASRAVLEADVVQLDHEQNRIYAMSKSGSLSVVDASEAGRLTLLGKTTLSGEPFEMYRRGDVLLTMSNRGVRSDGTVAPTLDDGTPLPPADARAGALVTAVDIGDPASTHQLSTLRVPGEIADSRVVGNVLYLATYQDNQCWSCTGFRTLVTSFDISDATTPKQVDQVIFESSGRAAGNPAWPTPWKRSIVATAERLYVGGLSSSTGGADEGVIEVLDITDPTGKLTRGATIATAGPILSRWQMDESDGVLRVISQRGAGRSAAGEAQPDIDTFRVESTTSMPRIGHGTITLPRQEGLKTVRFDGPRAYAITFVQTDPLFTIDLSDATHPVQRGQLEMQGWVYYLEPHGNSVIGLGLDRRDSAGNLSVSVFDVSDLGSPRLAARASFGPTNMYTDDMITKGVLAEDQDRIQKAFRVFDDGLIAVPFSAANGTYAGSGTGAAVGCWGGGVQLFDWTATSLRKQAFLPMAGNARRAIRRDSDTMKELIAVSDSNVTSFRIDDHATASSVADVVIGSCTPRTVYPSNNGLGDWEEGGGRMGDDVSTSYGGGMCE